MDPNSDKATAPETKQIGGSSLDLSQVPDDTRDWLKNKLGEDIPLTQENFLKMATSYQNAEKKIGQKEDEIVKSLFEDPDNKLMQALKEKQPEQKAKEEPPTEQKAEEGLTEEEAKNLLNAIQGEKSKEFEARQNALDAKLSESEKRVQREEQERNIRQLDTSYRELISQVPVEEVGPYVKAITELLWDSNGGGPRPDARILYNARNPVQAALKFYLSMTGSNPALLTKLSNPVYTESGGGSMPAGQASRKSPTDDSFDKAIEADRELDDFNRKAKLR